MECCRFIQKWQDKHIMDMKMHTFFFSGKEGRKQEYRVALAVIEDLHQNLEIMNVYAPTEELYEVAKFTKLWKEHNSMPNNIKMVIRDLNAKPGSEDTYRGVIYQKQPASGNQQ